MKRMWSLALWTLAFAAAGTDLWALSERENQRVVLMDISDDRSVMTSVDLAKLQECIPDVQQLCTGDAFDALKLRREMTCLIQDHSTRWLGSRGDTLTVYVVYGTMELGASAGPAPVIEFSEQKRRSRLATDLRALMSVALKATDLTAAGVDEPPGLACAIKQYALTHRRANLKVSVEKTERASSDTREAPPAGGTTGGSSAEAGEPIGKSGAPDTDKPAESTAVETTLRTGPSEHWFVSADVPLKQLNDVKFNDDSELDLAKKPTRWLVAMNFTPGDLAEDENNWSRSPLKNLVIKGQITLSKEPLDTFGVALGLRGRYLSSLGIDFDTITPFAGYLWTRSEADPANPTDTRLTGTWQVGVSFNISKALGWVSGGT